MAGLDELDALALENAYLGRVVLYVEAAADAEVFRRILGPGMADRLEVQVPPAASGWDSVKNRVSYERSANSKIFGLLDGEAAAAIAGWDPLVCCAEHVFTSKGHEGLIFLAGHELENLLMLHGGFCDVVADDVRLHDIGSHTSTEVRALLVRKAQRFFVSAILKYAVLNLQTQGREIALPTLGRFKSKDSTVAVLRAMRAEIVAQGVPWTDVSDEMRAIIQRLRTRFRAETVSKSAKSDHLIRLADGKGLIDGVRATINTNARWEGHLARNLTHPAYADRFRELIVEATAA